MAKIKIQLNETKKDSILKNAAMLFRSKGFKATSVRELADTLGIEAPSLYNHIGSKAELLQEICFDIATDYSTFMQTIISSSESADIKTKKLIEFHIQKLFVDFDKVYVADYEWKQLPKKQLEEFLIQRKIYENNFVEIIEEGIQKKLFKNLQPRITVLTILSAVRGLEFLKSKKNNFTVEVLQQNMVNHLLTGITN